jgi:radical SAM protein with 4Fe4S-binding SPASM domain
MKLRVVRARPERFGGIVETEHPRALLHVDRRMMRELGHPDSPSWTEEERSEAPLSAPTEVHVVLSRRCAAGCTGCYVDATPKGASLSLVDARRVLDELAAMGVFHVALGGGEALELPHLFEVAAYARSVGMTPNLTTSGLGLTAADAERCRVFGQINVSVDGVGAAYTRARGFDGFAHAARALRLLRAVKEEVGVNCVVSRTTFDGVGEVARLVRTLRLNELELLRFKPVGRGAGLDEELTPEQARRIYPLARRLMLRHRIRVKLDCSFAPMVFWHRPSARAAAFWGVQGCVAGDVLAAVAPEGNLMACSFAGATGVDARIPGNIRSAWPSLFATFRDFVSSAPPPCSSCEYLRLCRGGCRAVANAHGELSDPDPGCPRVQEWRAGHARRRSTRPASLALPVIRG